MIATHPHIPVVFLGQHVARLPARKDSPEKVKEKTNFRLAKGRTLELESALLRYLLECFYPNRNRITGWMCGPARVSR